MKSLFITIAILICTGCAVSCGNSSSSGNRSVKPDIHSQEDLLNTVNKKIDSIGVEALCAEIWNNATPMPISQNEMEAVAVYFKDNIEKTIYIDNPQTVNLEYPYFNSYRTILFTADEAGKLKGDALRSFDEATEKMRDAIEATDGNEEDLVTVEEVVNDPYPVF